MALLWRRRRKRSVRGSKQRSTAWHVMWGVGIMLAIALLLYGVWYVTRLPVFTISDISIEGGETVSHEDLRDVVEQELSGSYLLLIPYRFAYFYPEERIHEALSSVARVHNVSMERVSNTKLAITFDEYVPYALLCESGFESAQCYFLDDTGYAFSPAPPLRGGAFVRHVVEEQEARSGLQALDAEFLGALDGFIKALDSELGFRVLTVMHKTSGDVRLHLSEGGRLFVAKDSSMQEAFENLQSILTSREFDHLEPGNFNYIDLRFGNKIFVNEELEVVATSSDPALGEDEPSFVIE